MLVALQELCGFNRRDTATIVAEYVDDLNTLLILACRGGSGTDVEWFLSMGADPSFRGFKGFKKACNRMDLHVIKILINRGVSPQVGKSVGFRIACSKGYWFLARWFVKRGTDVKQEHVQDCLGQALIEACKKGNEENFVAVFELGLVLTSDIGSSAFFEACKTGNLRIIRLLQAKSTNIYEKANATLDSVCYIGRLKVAQWLCKLIPFDQNCLNSGFLSACMNGSQQTARYMVELGADVHAQNDKGFLHACQGGLFRGYMELFEWLLDMGVNPHTRNDEGISIACRHGNFFIVKKLCELGFDSKSPRFAEILRSAEQNYQRSDMFIGNSLIEAGESYQSARRYLQERKSQDKYFRIYQLLLKQIE